MSWFRGPNIVTNGLILNFDPANINSYRGESTINLESVVNISTWSTNYAGVTSGNTINLSGYNPFISYNLLPTAVNNMHRTLYSQGGFLSLNTMYTVSLYAKSNGYNFLSFGITDNSNYQTQTVFDLNLGVVTQNVSNNGGSIISSGMIYMGNGWYRCYLTISLSTYVVNNYFLILVRNDGVSTPWIAWLADGTSGVLISSPQIEQKSYATPFVNGTRGSTVVTGGGLIDLSGYGNSGTISGSTYVNEYMGGLFQNGLTNYIGTNALTPVNNTAFYTVEMWIKSKIPDPSYCILFRSGYYYFYLYNNSTTPDHSIYFVNRDTGFTWRSAYYNYATHNIPTQIVGVRDDTNLKLYVNGLLKNTFTYPTLGISNTNWTFGGNGGTESFSGNTYVSKVYNRALSDAEVLQNYNALKSRFEEKVIIDSLMLYLDAGKTNSFPISQGGGTGATWYDLTGRGNNGTILYGGYNYLNGGSIVLNGSSSYVNCGTNVDISNLGAMTVSVILNFNNVSNRQFIIGKCTSDGSSVNEFLVDLTSSTTIRFFSGSGNTWVPFTYVFSSGSTYDITFVRGGLTFRDISMYINGIYISGGTSSNSPLSSSTMKLSVGRGGDYDGLYFNGKIYNVRIYSRSLLASEILQNYNALKGRFN